MKRITFVALLLAVLVVPSFGALDAYLVIKGQGWTGPEKIKLIDFNNNSMTALEKSTGKFNGGHRKWTPFTITKTTDSASPKLMQFCASGKHYVTIQVYEKGNNGKVEPFYTITLTNATMTPLKFNTPGGKDQKGSVNEAERFSFTFTKIEWTWVKGGVTASDDWEARV